MLAPLARVLGITTDTLLSYREELTDQEIENIQQELVEKAMHTDYPSLFSWGTCILKEYPNSEKLAAKLLPLLDSYRMILGALEEESYEDYILVSYQRLLKSKDPDLVHTAAHFLFCGYLRREDYVKAEEALQYLPSQDTNSKMMQALLYRKKGETQKAYELYEKLVWEGYHTIAGAFSGIYALAETQKDLEREKLILEKQEKLAKLLDMGRYQEIYLQLGLALEEKNTEEVIRIFTEMIQSLKGIPEFQKSSLYAHMNWKDSDRRSTAFLLRKALTWDDTIPFLKEDSRYEQLLQELDELCASADS